MIFLVFCHGFSNYDVALEHNFCILFLENLFYSESQNICIPVTNLPFCNFFCCFFPTPDVHEQTSAENFAPKSAAHAKALMFIHAGAVTWQRNTQCKQSRLCGLNSAWCCSATRDTSQRPLSVHTLFKSQVQTVYLCCRMHECVRVTHHSTACFLSGNLVIGRVEAALTGPLMSADVQRVPSVFLIAKPPPFALTERNSCKSCILLQNQSRRLKNRLFEGFCTVTSRWLIKKE